MNNIMINNIKGILSLNFNFIVNEIKKLEPAYHGYLFDFIKRKQYGESKMSYLGEKLCGEACYVVRNLLLEKGLSSQVKYNMKKYGDYIDDHCFLQINNIIIDPTYRQFFVQYFEQNNINTNIIFENNDPFFCGTINDLIKLVNNLNIKDKEIIDYWNIDKDITSKFVSQ